MSNLIGSTNRSTGRLARLRRTKVNPAVARSALGLPEVFDYLLHHLSLTPDHSNRPAQRKRWLLSQFLVVVSGSTYPSYPGSKDHSCPVYPSNPSRTKFGKTRARCPELQVDPAATARLPALSLIDREFHRQYPRKLERGREASAECVCIQRRGG